MNPKTLGEVSIMFENLLGQFRHLADKLEENTKLTTQILAQATKTNGRMNTVEPLALDYQENRARIKGGLIVVSILGAAIVGSMVYAGKLYIDSLRNEITIGVVTTLEKTYNITYEKQ